MEQEKEVLKSGVLQLQLFRFLMRLKKLNVRGVYKRQPVENVLFTSNELKHITVIISLLHS